MPDITMCKGGKCPMRDTCYRYTATPWMRQSYFIRAPWHKAGLDFVKPWCEYIIQIPKEKE